MMLTLLTSFRRKILKCNLKDVNIDGQSIWCSIWSEKKFHLVSTGFIPAENRSSSFTERPLWLDDYITSLQNDNAKTMPMCHLAETHRLLASQPTLHVFFLDTWVRGRLYAPEWNFRLVWKILCYPKWVSDQFLHTVTCSMIFTKIKLKRLSNSLSPLFIFVQYRWSKIANCLVMSVDWGVLVIISKTP